MDNLVLHRLALDLSAELEGSFLRQLRQEAGDRFRLIFARGDRSFSLLVSLAPELPWLGAPVLRWTGPRWSPEDAVATLAKRAVGLCIAAVSKAPADRSVTLLAGDGSGLAIELQAHASNLVLLGPGGVVESVLRGRKRSAERLALGKVWSAPPRPPDRLDPFEASAAALDAGIDQYVGLGQGAAVLARAEADRTGRSPGTVLADRLAEVREGRGQIVILGPEPPRDAIRSGTFAAPVYRLLPWRPAGELSERLWQERSALATAGLFHDGLETVARLRRRIDALHRIVGVELRKTIDARARVEAEARRFEAPEDLVRRAEALLAGLTRAERVRDGVEVPDPYDPGGPPIIVPAKPGVALTEVANDLFRKSRRARRGAAAVAERSRSLAERASRLEGLLGRPGAVRTEEDAVALEGAMRAQGIPVGLERATRAGKAAEKLEAPRIAGIRVLTSADGWSILVGKTSRDNDRLTFKHASPEDLWLHAAGTAGAHVVVKASGRGEVPETTLREAAQAAAWFSDARGEGTVEVHWTRRKHVRRAGGTAGKVVLKRFQSIRVRPSAPRERD